MAYPPAMPPRPNRHDQWTAVGDAQHDAIEQAVGDVDGARGDITAIRDTLAAARWAPTHDPAFTGTVTGISKAMVGLGNVDNTTDGQIQLAAERMTSGTIDPARLPTDVAGFRVRAPVDERNPTATNWGPRPAGHGVVIAVGAPPSPADAFAGDLHVPAAGTGNTGTPTDPGTDPGTTPDPGTVTGPSTPTGSPAGTWLLTFADDFTGGLDTRVWTPLRGAPGETYNSPINPAGDNHAYSADRVSVTGGVLRLAWDKTPITSYGTTYPYTASYAHTATGLTVREGTFIEARIRLSTNAPGLWPAFWLLPLPINTWPPEVDIAEFVQADTPDGKYHPHFNVHWSEDGGATSKQAYWQSYGPSGVDYADGAWHTYGLEWVDGRIQVWLDGQPGPSYTGPGLDYIGTLYPVFSTGVMKGYTPPAGHMDVDYLRTWQLQDTSVPTDPGTVPPPPPQPAWATSTGLASTGWREIALRLTSTAENSTTNWASQYGYIEDIGDGRGYTAGIVGFCSGTGDMLALVEYANTAYPSNSLAKWLPQLRQIMAASYSQRPALSNSLLGSAFKTDWANASAQAWFQDCQRRERDRVYWGPALAAAQEDGVGLLGLCILYDISVNHGPGTDSESFGGIVANARAATKPPSKGGNEAAYLTKLTDLRNTVLQGWGDNQATDGRVFFHRKLIANNPGMTFPISWTCYGEPFSITSMPTEGGLAAVDLTDEADIIVAADSSNFDGSALVGTINSNSISTATRDDYVIRFPGAQWLAGFRQMARNVCSILYNKQSEVPRTHAVVKLTFTANDMLAAATASTGGIEFGNQSRGAAVTASYTTHEVVHLYQNGASYGTSQQATGTIEGIADLVLIRLGYHPAQSRRPAGGGTNWYDGYDTTGFFFDWIERYAPTPSPGFVKKLNAALTASTFNPSIITSLNARGKTVDALWTEYKAYVAALPAYAGGGSTPTPTATIGQRLDLTNWKVTLPTDSTGGFTGTAAEIKQPSLGTYKDTYIYPSTDGAGVTFAPVCGGSTTSGSEFPRCELREMTSSGSANASWGFNDGKFHEMVTTLRVDRLMLKRPMIVVAQIHDAADDCWMAYADGFWPTVGNAAVTGTATGGFRIKWKWNSVIQPDPLIPEVRIGQLMTIRVRSENNTVKIWADTGTSATTLRATINNAATTFPNSTSSGCYFKTGAYLQSNTTNSGKTVPYNTCTGTGTSGDDLTSPVAGTATGGDAAATVGAVTVTKVALAHGTAATVPTTPVATLPFTDRENVSFTGAGKTSKYHAYASGLAAGAGLMIWLHGDAAYEFNNPSSSYIVGGSSGIRVAAKNAGFILASCLAPDTSGTVTWWESGNANADYLKALIDSLKTGYAINPSRVVLAGFSGGAQQVTQFFMGRYPEYLAQGGATIVFGGGEAPDVTPTYSAAVKSAIRMHWCAGANDTAANASDGFDGRATAEYGEQWFRGKGFNTSIQIISGKGHDVNPNFGPVVAAQLARFPS